MNEGSAPQMALGADPYARPGTRSASQDNAGRGPDQILTGQTSYGGMSEAQPPAPGLAGPAVARGISIEPVHHGFIVIVGCQRFAVESVDALLHRLNVYLKNPIETEKRWMAGEWKW